MAEKDKPFQHVLVVGCGDIGHRVAKIWQNRGFSLHGVVKTATSAQRLQQQGITPHQHDLDHPGQAALPTGNALLYYLAPPPASGKQDTRMQTFLASLVQSGLPQRIIYLGTSGVYGDQQGRLVNEQTPPNPQVDRAHRRLHAETQLQQWSKQHQVELTLLRVGGIYGPGRLPLKRIQDQVPMLHEHLAPLTNRIHADDLAQVCVAAAAPQAAGEIYNVSDGCDSNMSEYFNTIADFFGLPRPPMVDWEEAERTISKGMLSYLRESRRMDNRKMLRELDITLQYPSLKDGLPSCK